MTLKYNIYCSAILKWKLTFKRKEGFGNCTYYREFGNIIKRKRKRDDETNLKLRVSLDLNQANKYFQEESNPLASIKTHPWGFI